MKDSEIIDLLQQLMILHKGKLVIEYWCEEDMRDDYLTLAYSDENIREHVPKWVNLVEQLEADHE